MEPKDEATLLLIPDSVNDEQEWDTHQKGTSNHRWRFFYLICLVVFIQIPFLSSYISSAKVRKEPVVPSFYHLPFIKDLNCGLLFENSSDGSQYREKLSKQRVIYENELSLETDCASIRSRGYFSRQALTEEEKNFPIAFARIVYKDYYLLESALRVEYAPQNFYCYLLDSKTDKLFKKRVRNLRKCFNNIIVPNEEIDVKSDGHNMTIAHLTCMKYLRSYPWEYIILLQNDDMRLRTNAELVKILKIFNGTNDISATDPQPHAYHPEANWTLAALDLFKDKRLNTLESIKVTKSLVQVSISREAVDYVFENLNVGPLIKQLELKEFGVDETFWGTLNSNEIINLPGGFTRKYLEHKIPTYMITRYTIWEIDTKPRIPCESEFFRRWVCIFGVEDLPDIAHLYNLYVNKLLSKFDFAAATCLLEHVYNNTYFPMTNHSLDFQKYSELRHVKFHNGNLNGSSIDFDHSELPKVFDK